MCVSPLLMFSKSVMAMEIIFGQKYPIAQKSSGDQLSWLSVQFEKDPTGKVVYRLEASHPTGKKLSYLKGKDYLLSEDIQKNMIRNFEVKVPEVEFDANGKIVFEVVLPYDFQTRYLPLKFEKPNGYQELVLRLRFGDYRFMLASRVLNNVSYIESVPMLAAKQLEQLYSSRSMLKKRAPKLVEKAAVAQVNVDDIYNDIRQDLNIESRIDKYDGANAVVENNAVDDDFDALLSKYSPTETKSQPEPSRDYAINPQNLNASGKSLKVKGKEVSFEDSQMQSGYNGTVSSAEQDILNNPTTEKDYNSYVNDLMQEDKNTEFKSDATIDEIIAKAGQFDNEEQEIGTGNLELSSEDQARLLESESALNSELQPKAEEIKPKPKKQVYIPPVDAEELFGFVSDNWVEPKSAPILVIKPKPVDQKRRISSFEPPKRNNFVEMVPAKKPKPAGVNMDDLFGGGNTSEANPNGFGF